MKKTIITRIKYILPVMLALLVLLGAALNDEKRPLAFVQKFRPNVGVTNGGLLKTVEKRGAPLFNGDTLRTDDGGFALVQFMDKSIAKVKPESRLIVEGTVEGRDNTYTRLGLEAGEVFFNVTKQGRDNFEVATNTTVASVKGTEFGVSSRDYFWVEEGEVALLVNESGNSASLTAGMYGRVQDDGSIDTGDLSDDELDDLRKDYDEVNEKAEPKIYKLRFIDSNGEEQVIEIKVFENEN